MMVIFVSQCEKNALNKTRRVLDSFSDRIGSKTWQTIITNEGLSAVKKLLAKTATKNTAVSCHWIRGRNRSELVWIVGNRQKFNRQGIMPVNITQQNVNLSKEQDNWIFLPLIQSITAISALLHDWGKASLKFQQKLQPEAKGQRIDPLRHEWMSVLLFRALIRNDSDLDWLDKLIDGKINQQQLQQWLQQWLQQSNPKKPLADLSDLASMIVWLIVTHHKLPILSKSKAEGWQDELAPTLQKILNYISDSWGYRNSPQEEEKQRKLFEKDLEKCFQFPNGLLAESEPWLKQLKKWATRLKNCLNSGLLEQVFTDGSWRVILYYSRLSLMLGDHNYSAQQADANWQGQSNLYANSDRKSKQLKQKLDEHLVGVAKYALRVAYLLPSFESQLPKALDLRKLKQKSPVAYQWQDKAVNKLKQWRVQLSETTVNNQGFFAVNMASTGCGKTFANAKIMRILSEDGESLRYVLALGLRTLTLQTGDEYRERIFQGGDSNDLAVLIGSQAVVDLHQINQQQKKVYQQQLLENYERAGSESLESLLDDDVMYDCAIPETPFSTVLTDQRSRKFLYAPILVCTIDHLMAATETKRGGRYILPSLRLMSSDLVIDEIDDFDGNDLIAIGRLIHLVAMLGRKVMISSATIPPDLAEGYFHAYWQGWQLFASSRGIRQRVHCAWVDEFATHVETVVDNQAKQAVENYQALHQKFIQKRIKSLKKQAIKRQAKIITCVDSSVPAKDSDDLTIEQRYFADIQHAIINKHQDHANKDFYTNTMVSFGVVRVANIDPCIQLTEYLLNAEWDSNVDVRIMAYHSQQILLMRSKQEQHLDEVLTRKDPQAVFNHPVIRQHIKQSQAKQLIFILVATPVEEIGRDHDFDWAVVEPSSYRSIIQLAGRVLRHRKIEPKTANVALMQYNLKGVKGLNQTKRQVVFCQPGYENRSTLLDSHDLKELLPPKIFINGINAIPRIQKPKTLQQNRYLADLEHYRIHELLTEYEQKGPESLQGWLVQHWWLTALPQVLSPFRCSQAQLRLYRVWDDNKERWRFAEKDTLGQIQFVDYKITNKSPLTSLASQRLWLVRDYAELVIELADRLDMSEQKVTLKYGEISLPMYNDNSSFYYSEQLGMGRRP